MTKTAAGRRAVNLLMPAMEVLKAHAFSAAAEVFQKTRTLARWTGDGPIRKKMWVPAMKKAGVRYRRPYQTRHTYLSMMLSAGEHPMWVAKPMGHTDWRIIARVYGKWMPSADLDAGGKAKTLWTSSSGASISPTIQGRKAKND
ncbi:site-specific integrase [Pseudomonas viridiflava]|uniref:site-specific integrase n=1 Tax=Pseudomonas viridiflava TaxID=33069 RepID=UPI0030EB32C3